LINKEKKWEFPCYKFIANTRTSKRLEIIAKLDHSKYETGIKVTDEEFKSIVLKKDDFQGKWNYKIKPWKQT